MCIDSLYTTLSLSFSVQADAAILYEPKPDYVVRPARVPEKFSCPCCGAEMKSEKILEKSTLYRCTGCGISDTRLNS